MNPAQPKPNTDKKLVRIILLLIIALAVFSNAMKELSQTRAFVAEVAEVVARWSDSFVPTASARTPTAISTVNVVKREAIVVRHSQERSGEFRWNGSVAPGQTVEIKGINGDITAEAGGNEVQVLAIKTSRRTDLDTVQVKVVPHGGGVTICALYPTESGYSDCEPGSGTPKNSSNTNNSVKNNDVRVDFTVKIPARVAFVGKTVNGDISATALSGNVDTKTINGSITISTTGFAQASTINGSISARLGDANWSGPLHFKTINGAINLDLPASVSTEVDAETLNGQINSDFPINLISFKERKHVRGRIGAGGRELMLKTLNGSINLRLVS
jgi:hypothetical protein